MDACQALSWKIIWEQNWTEKLGKKKREGDNDAAGKQHVNVANQMSPNATSLPLANLEQHIALHFKMK